MKCLISRSLPGGRYEGFMEETEGTESLRERLAGIIASRRDEPKFRTFQFLDSSELLDAARDVLDADAVGNVFMAGGCESFFIIGMKQA